MAEYTMELRQVLENHNIFDFDYDFYDETKRNKFQQDFIRHFYFREIGTDTIDRFKLYLEDKMHTVFPYYNELFRSASIEYDVLDNYKLTETFERSVEDSDQTNGSSYSVGQSTDKQESEVNDSRQTDSKQNQTNINTGSQNDNSNTQTTGTGKTKTTGKMDKTDDNVKKFLDTPQGLTDLTNSKYLTTLNHDTLNGESNSESEEDKSESGNSQTSHSSSSNSQTKSNGDSEQTSKGNAKSTASGEQKVINDSNIRNYSEHQKKESYTIKRRGNIGVDTDSDAIEKHNRLQKTLKSIERMFFDECEDLFMLVY